MSIQALLRSCSPFLAAAACVLLSCGNDFDGIVVLACPPIDDFTLVSGVLEQRCGSLDCHGSINRPLKIYGNRGLRLYTADQLTQPEVAIADGVFPGGKPTTNKERDANRRSICGLEPNKMGQVLAGELDPKDLMVLRKPTQADFNQSGDITVERHKGGPQFAPGGPGEECLRSWLLGGISEDDCREALKNP